jgi:hypothetical protein
MKNGLSRSRPIIKHGAIAFRELALARELCGKQLEFAQHRSVFLRRFGQRNQVLSGTDQDVGGSLRLNVFESEYFRVLVHQLRRNFLASDFAEQAIAHVRSFVVNGTVIPSTVAQASACGLGDASLKLTQAERFAEKLKNCQSEPAPAGEESLFPWI